jgi:hypothetical protein
LTDPGEIRRFPIDVEDEEFGQLVWMELAQPCLEGRQPIGRRLDHDLMLLVLLDRSLPPVDGDHGGEHIHAGGEAFVDESPRQAERIGFGADRGERDPDGGRGR